MTENLPGTEEQPAETPRDSDEHIDGSAVNYRKGPHTSDDELPEAKGGVAE